MGAHDTVSKPSSSRRRQFPTIKITPDLGITVCSAIATGKRNWPDAANYWAWHLQQKPQSPRTTRTSMNQSPDLRCASVQSATVAAWSRSRCCRPTDHQQSGTPHERHGIVPSLFAASAGLALPNLQRSPAFPNAASHITPPISVFSCLSIHRNRRRPGQNDTIAFRRTVPCLRSEIFQPFQNP